MIEMNLYDKIRKVNRKLSQYIHVPLGQANTAPKWNSNKTLH